MPPPRATLPLAIGLILAAGAGRAAAQNPDDPTFRPQDYGLDSTPVVHEGLGLRMYVPGGASVVPARQGGESELQLAELTAPGQAPAWRVHVSQIRMLNLPDPTPAGLAAQLVREFEQRGNVTVLANEPFGLGDRTGQLLYLKLSPSGATTDENAETIVGYLIASTGSERYVTFRILIAEPEAYERTRRNLDPALRTIRLTSTIDLEQRRVERIELAARAVRTLTPERLQSVTGRTQWFRIYKPGGRGDWMSDQEIGYYKLEVREAARGEINPQRDPSNFAPGESEVGLLVAVDARYLEDAARNLYADVQTRFWMSWDRDEEAWQTLATRRHGEASVTEAEVGVRTPSSFGSQRLKVVKNNIETRDRKEYDWLVEQPYLAQPEVFLLGSLLPRDGSITGTMAFNFYEPSLEHVETLPHRIDTWNAATDGSGNWILKSQITLDSPETVSIFERDGNLLKRTKADGTVTEPIEFGRLLEIWQTKRLPTRG